MLECQVLPGRVSVFFYVIPPPPARASLRASPPLPEALSAPRHVPGALQLFQQRASWLSIRTWEAPQSRHDGPRCPKTAREAPNTAPSDPKQEVPKMQPSLIFSLCVSDAFHVITFSSFGRSRAAPGAPKTGPTRSKRPPKESRDSPRKPQESSKRELRPKLARGPLQDGPSDPEDASRQAPEGQNH